ncbi:hypothetical protein CKM354_000487700 [Cercospora kikuchii]|uniref:ZZ-type domain-containing protein n=1 Tax=Cercospora kikuchii TaxID=84275 RepID=A0A9P3CND6_9PEZI|nr:uncharacterized protein CKM354_000487700 [Cercospora kikuchii]GIZ41578.1 hypothetical protein CKM354_000487700 [Cercospora kikuchii]
MHIVNLRHPGYEDLSNIILTLQAPDDPDGGIHAETLRLAGCILAGNRWDGFLSSTQRDAKPVVPDKDGILRGKDYYFHVPQGKNEAGDDVFDRRKHSDSGGPWPVVARFADWEWPENGLPEIWKLAEQAIARQAEQVKSGIEATSVDSNRACRLCGRDEECGMSRLWRNDTDADQVVFEREKSKISIAVELRGDYGDDDDEEQDQGTKSETESNDGDDQDDEDGLNEKKAADQTSAPEGEEEKGENDSESGSSDTTESESESSEDGSDSDDDPLYDNRNWIRLGRECSAEPDDCDAKEAFRLYKWLLVPKFEQDGQPIICAHIFNLREDGITAASHNQPLKLPWKSSIELLFAHFVQAIFEHIEVFFTAGTERVVRIMDADGRKIILEADAEMCGLLTVPSVTKTWPIVEDSEGAESADDDSDTDDDDEEPEIIDSDEDDAADADASDEDATDGDDDDAKNEAVPANPDQDQLEEQIITSAEFQAHMQELAAMLADTGVEDTDSEVPETVTRRVFLDIGCDVCDQQIYDICYACLDCGEYDLCAGCVGKRETEHPGHRFLPLYESGWRQEVPTGKMIARDKADADSSDDDSSSSTSEHKNDEDLESRFATLLETHIESGDFLQYLESLADTSPTKACIRILHLEPGKGEEPIVGHLETVKLLDIFPFEALSYCWGNPEPRRIINISDARLEVGTNLKLALHRLRQPDNVRKLWIDGICINQGDVHEKTAQVTMMREIYEKAEQTIVWLGEEADDSRMALEMCNRMVNAHGNTYIRQTLGVDVEKLFVPTADDGDESEAFDEAKLQQMMTEVGTSFDLDHALYNQAFKATTDAMKTGKAYEGPLEEAINQALADEGTNQEELASIDWEDVGRRIAQGEEYDGPLKEFVYAQVAEAMAELEEEGEADTDSEAQAGEDQSKVDAGEETATIATTDEATEESAAIKAPSGSTYHHSVILQILRARQQNKDDPAAAEPPTSEEIAALYALFERPWFSRIWIVQEAGVSSKILVQCGSHQIDWWAFSFGFLITQKLKRVARLGPKSHRNLVVMSRTRSSIHVGNSMKHMMNKPDPDLSITSLLSTYRGYEATDPRDKVFALLGIASSSEGLVPDYTKSCEAVYRDVAATLLQRSSHLELLASCHATPERNESKPSWVPDWSDLTRKPYKLAGNQNFESSEVSTEPLRIFKASAETTTTSSRLKIEDNKLHLQGYITEKISAVSSILLIDQQDLLMPVEFSKLTDGQDFTSMIKSITRFFSVLKTFPTVIEDWKDFADIHNPTSFSPSTSASNEDNFTIFARTLWTDLKDPETCVSDCKEWLEKLKGIHNLMQKLPSFDNVEPDEENFMALIFAMVPVMQGLDPNEMKLLHELGCVHTLDRRLARTESGKLCLAPATTEVGDDVALLHGGRTPYILRAVAGEEEGYVLVGETYVHGMMYGEAWEPARCQELCLV